MHTDRKKEHLDICLEQDVSSEESNGFERYKLVHCALPEMNLADVDLSCHFLGHQLAAPIIISAMTGGTERARALNQSLARAAQRFGLAMCLGSQRALLEDPQLFATYAVREVAPDILLMANLGAIQLQNGYSVAECQAAVDRIGADALVLHLNPLQEALQPGGDTNYRGLLEKIHEVCLFLRVPVIIKEVGYGLSVPAAKALLQAGAAALDIAGAGGTSWSQVEKLRAATPEQAQIADAFRGWGIPTAEALEDLRHALPKSLLIASGGITNGVEAAKALALGADIIGMALPLLKAANRSEDDLHNTLHIILEQLRIALFCTGSRNPLAMRRADVLTRIHS